MSDSPTHHHRRHHHHRRRHSRDRSRSREHDDYYDRKVTSKSRDYRASRYSRSRSPSRSKDRHRSRRHRSRSRDERRRRSQCRSRSHEKNRRHRNRSRSRESKQPNGSRHSSEAPDEPKKEMTESDEERNAIHEEMHERLRQMAAAEGKSYPHPGAPPVPTSEFDPSDPTSFVFANDGSFLENFKKMQEMYQQQQLIQQQVEPDLVDPVQHLYLQPSRPVQPPIVGRRRGGKILKTGIVAKPKVITADQQAGNSKDPWSIYLQEVQKYKNNSCDADSKTRPLVK